VNGTDHKTLVPVKELKPYVIGMFRRYLAGDSLTAICEWLDAEGVKPPRGRGIWAQKSVSQILKNPIYGTGRRCEVDPKTREYGKTVLKVEPMVDAKLARDVIAKLDSAPRKRGAVSTDTAMLTGIAVCAKCNGPMYRTILPRKDGKAIVYACRGPARKPEGYQPCKNLVPLEWLHRELNDLMLHGARSGDMTTHLFVEPGHNHDEEMKDIELDIQSLSPRDPEYRAKHSALMAEWERLDNADAVPAIAEKRPTGTIVAQHWATLDDQGKRAFLLRSELKLPVLKGRGITIPSRQWVLDVLV
jgi:hypothetical protein